MLTAAEYRANLQQATFAERMEQARDVTDDRLACDVEHGALTAEQRQQVEARRAEMRLFDADEDVAS